MKTVENVFFYLLPLAIAAQAKEIYLKDGTVLQGERIRIEDSIIVFRTSSLGEVRVLARELVLQDSESVNEPPIENIQPHAEREGVDPSVHGLVLMPTAFTPPPRSVSFEDFELLFLTFTVSMTASTTITIGALFPVAPGDVEAFTLGFKQRLYQSPSGLAALALTGSFTKVAGNAADDVPGFWTGNIVGSFAFPDPSGSHAEVGGIHLAIGDAGSWNTDNVYNPITGRSEQVTKTNNDISFALGSDIRMTPRSKFMIEYLNGGHFLGNSKSEAFINLGIRIHGQHLSADICGFRLIDENMGDIFMLPMINIGYLF